jgi:carbonic anhydrase
MKSINNLIEGYKTFHKNYFQGSNILYESLKYGQSPHSLIISCSDSRVDPITITAAKPGEIFVIRNVANIVPPFCEDHDTQNNKHKVSYHGVSAAIEFAVKVLCVENIIIIGHSNCSGIATLLENKITKNKKPSNLSFDFLNNWVDILSKACENEDRVCQDTITACGKRGVIISLENLSQFPWVKDKILNKSLSINGWFFDIASGELLEYRDKEFIPLDNS